MKVSYLNEFRVFLIPIRVCTLWTFYACEYLGRLFLEVDLDMLQLDISSMYTPDWTHNTIIIYAGFDTKVQPVSGPKSENVGRLEPSLINITPRPTLLWSHLCVKYKIMR